MSTARATRDDLGPFEMCTPAKAGASASAVTGIIIWALVAYIPAFRNGVPLPVQVAIPFVLAWGVHTFTAWAVRHPAGQLADPVTPPPEVSAAPGDSPAGQQGPVPAGEAGSPGAGHAGSLPSAAPGQPFTRYYPPGPGWRRW